MAFSADLLTLLLYLAQQLGMMLGFGSEIILLFTYLSGRRDGIISQTEYHVARSIYRVLIVSLICIIVSGIGITALYVLANNTSILFAPAFIFKWLLLCLAVLFAFLLKGSHLWNHTLEGLAGATWGVLFLVHIFAPVTTLSFLLEFYAVWTVVFLGIWQLAHFAFRGTPSVQKNTTPVQPSTVPEQTLLPPEQPAHQLIQTQPISMQDQDAHIAPISQSHIDERPVERGPIKPLVPIYNPEALPGLPTIRVMPQTHEELQQSVSQSVIKPA